MNAPCQIISVSNAFRPITLRATLPDARHLRRCEPADRARRTRGGRRLARRPRRRTGKHGTDDAAQRFRETPAIERHIRPLVARHHRTTHAVVRWIVPRIQKVWPGCRPTLQCEVIVDGDELQ
jgi:hypothetical protein